MGVTNRTELRVKRNMFKVYLERDHIELALKRPILEQTDAGGVRRGPPIVLVPQKFRLYPFVRRMTRITRDTPDGDIINLGYVLLGLWDADVAASDYFEHDGGLYDIVSIDPKREDRVAANVTFRGPADDEAWG